MTFFQISLFVGVGYQQGSFIQTNGNAYPVPGQPSPHGLLNGNSRTVTPTLNGNIDYVDQSPRPSDYLNGGTYTHPAQVSFTPYTRIISKRDLSDVK